MGPVISILTVVAIVYCLINCSLKRALILSFIVAFYTLMGASRHLVANYYLIPALPFIFLLIAEFIDYLIEAVKNKFPMPAHKKTMALLCCTVLLLYHPVMVIGKHLLSLSGKNTRYVAKEWIEKNIPAGSKILMDSGKSINSFSPPIAAGKGNLQQTIERTKENIDSGVIVHGMVDNNALIYYELLLKTVPEIAFDLHSTMFGLGVKEIDYYIENNFEYFVISEDMRISRTVDDILRIYPDVAKFYGQLDVHPRIRRIKTISPTKYSLGDTFHIYEVMGRS
jgi:hypothetical protein